MRKQRFTLCIEDLATGRWERVIGTAEGYIGRCRRCPVGLLEVPADLLDQAQAAERRNRIRRVIGQRVAELAAD